MQIIDAFAGTFDVFPAGIFSLDLWRRYASAISPTLPDMLQKDAAAYDFSRDVLPVLQQFSGNRKKAETAHRAFLRVVSGLEERWKAALGSVPEVTVVLYLGLCNGAGWATQMDGRPAILLGLEKIVELDWCSEENMIALVYHELGHLWHFDVRKTSRFSDTPCGRALWQLYTEGMAMYAEQILCGNLDFFHQDRNGWLLWCRENRTRLFAEYLRRTEAGESVQDFFGDWCAYDGHADVGYFLGAELMRSLAATCSLQALADLSERDILTALRKWIG